MTLIKSISGIRGTIGGEVGDNLTPIDVVKFTSAYGVWIKKQNSSNSIVVGRDARISGSMVQNLVMNTLIALGFDVIDIDLSTQGHDLRAAEKNLHERSLVLLDDKGAKTNLSIDYMLKNNFKIINETDQQVLLSY